MGKVFRHFVDILLVLLVQILISVPNSSTCYTNHRLIPIPLHSDKIFVINGNKEHIKITSEYSKELYQVAIFDFTEIKNVITQRFSQTTFEICSEIPLNYSEIINLNVRGTTWIFHSESALPERFPTSILDNIYLVSPPGRRSKEEIYQIKRMKFRKRISGFSRGSTLRRRKDFNGITLQVAYVNVDKTPPPTYSSSGSETLAYRGWETDDIVSYHILAFMQDFLNFSVQFHEASSWVWAPSNITFSMADLVTNKNLDLAISNTGLWASRDYRFLFVTRIFRENFVYYHPPQNSNAKDLTKAIRIEVWVCFILYGITIFIAAIFIFQEEPQDLFIWTIASITEKGVPVPRSIYNFTAKYFTLACSVAGLLFYVSISAFLVSSFSFQDEINDLSDLVSRRYRFGLWANSILHNGFKDKMLSETSALWQIRSLYTTFDTEIRGATEVINKKSFAFVSGQAFYLNYQKAFEKLDICGNMKVIVLQGEKRWGSAFVKKNSEFADYFNFARLTMFQAGITNRILKERKLLSDSAKPRCIDRDWQQQQKGISFQEIRLSFVIFSIGPILGGIILIFEIWYLHRKKRKIVVILRQAFLNKLKQPA